MHPFQERKKLRKIIYSKATLLVLFVVFIFVARGAWQIHQKAIIAHQERDEAVRMLTDVQTRTAELQAGLKRLKSEIGTEAEIRQKFTVAKSNEEVVIVVDDDEKKGENSVAPEQSLWAKCLSFFGF